MAIFPLSLPPSLLLYLFLAFNLNSLDSTVGELDVYVCVCELVENTDAV